MSLTDIIKLIIETILKLLQKPVPTPTPTPEPTNIVAELLQLHNNYRQHNGLKPFALNQLLINTAQKHSNWMLQTKTLNHFEGSTGPGERISAEGYKWRAYGENIAEGYPTAQAVFNGWLNSSGHRANIVSPNFKDVGFGCSGKYWTTDFAASSGGPAISLPSGIKYQENNGK
jgi:uncharacterized protein YkwD